MLPDRRAQLIADDLGVPQGPAQPVLKAIGRHIAAHFGELPAGLSLGRTQQAPQIGHGPLPRLRAFERGRQAARNVVQVGGAPLDHRYVPVQRRSAQFLHAHHESSLCLSTRNHDTRRRY
jgi:hypothetical protein